MPAKLRQVIVYGDYAEIPLTKGYRAIIDAKDAEEVGKYNWYARVEKHTVYAARNTPRSHGPRKTIFMQRMLLAAGDGMTVDHIDRDGLNNRRSNLRVCSWAENQWNSKAQDGTRSGLKGVNWHKARKKWQARIRVNGKRISLGYFDEPESAHAAYAEASKAYHKDLGRT